MRFRWTIALLAYPLAVRDANGRLSEGVSHNADRQATFKILLPKKESLNE
jgi:hypothetical protein